MPPCHADQVLFVGKKYRVSGIEQCRCRFLRRLDSQNPIILNLNHIKTRAHGKYLSFDWRGGAMCWMKKSNFRAAWRIFRTVQVQKSDFCAFPVNLPSWLILSYRNGVNLSLSVLGCVSWDFVAWVLDPLYLSGWSSNNENQLDLTDFLFCSRP